MRRLYSSGDLVKRESCNYLSGVDTIRTHAKYPIIARPDCVLENGKLKIIELNYDSGLGGIYQTSYINGLYSHSQDYANYDFPCLSRHYSGLFRKLGNGTGILLIYTSRANSDVIFSINCLAREIELVTGIPCRSAHFNDVDITNKCLIDLPKFKFDLLYRMNWLEGKSDEALRYASFIYEAETSNVTVLFACRDTLIQDTGMLAAWRLLS
mgnify:CR=1 FL=1